MTIKEFNTKIINQGFTQIDKHIVFETPYGKVYSNVEIVPITQGNEVICKVKLTDKIEPKFKVGDVVTNANCLYPDVKCTISKVNYDEQYYCYKEVAGVTYFKDQDKLTLVNDEEVRPPVEDETKFAEYILAAVKTMRTTKLKGSITFNIPKNIDTFKLGCKLSYNEDLKISAELSNNGTDTITIKW